jgi:hypothetical protein
MITNKIVFDTSLSGNDTGGIVKMGDRTHPISEAGESFCY